MDCDSIVVDGVPNGDRTDLSEIDQQPPAQLRQQLLRDRANLKARRIHLIQQRDRIHNTQATAVGKKAKNNLAARKCRLNRKIDEINSKLSTAKLQLKILQCGEVNEKMKAEIKDLEAKLEQYRQQTLHDEIVSAQATAGDLTSQSLVLLEDKRQYLLSAEAESKEQLNALRAAYWQRLNELKLPKDEISRQMLEKEKELIKSQFENKKLEISGFNREMQILSLEQMVDDLKQENGGLLMQMQMRRQEIKENGEAFETMQWSGQGEQMYLQSNPQELVEDAMGEGTVENLAGDEQNPFVNFDIDEFFAEASNSFDSNGFFQ